MGDRCYIEITMRRSDLSRFAAHVDAAPAEKWWDCLTEEENRPGVVTVSVYEANYGWYDERAAAAKDGIPFYGTHADGGEYGPYAFASWNGEHCETPLNHDCDLILAVDEDLKPIQRAARRQLRNYVSQRKAIRAAFATAESEQSLEVAA
jgi:hypothetical protein